MPRRAQPIKLTVADDPNPKYPSLEACLRANIPLLCWLVTPHPSVREQQLQDTTDSEQVQANNEEDTHA